jgi:hypothetical protein
MALNPNISLGVRGIEIANPLAQYSQVAQIQNAQNQNQLAQFQLGSAQRAEKSQNLLADAYAQSTDPATGKIDYNKLTGLVAAGGGGTQIPAIQKSRLEFETAQTAQQKAQTDLLDAKLKQSRGFLDTLDPNDPTAPARYIAWHEANHKDPVIGPALTARGVSVDQSRQSIETAIAKGPAAFAALLNQSKLGTEKFMELNKPTTQVVDQSGQRQVLQIPGLGGTPTSVGTYSDVPLPANVQAQKIQIAQQSRPPRAEAAPRTQQITLSDGSLGIVNMDTGVIIPSTMAGAPVKGKPSAFAEKTAAQKVQMGKDLGFAITQLSDITKDGGLIDQSTGSGAGRLADVGAGFFGQATPGAIAIGKIAPIADLVLKMVPRFEGPQSDKDTASYKQAAGQLADPTLPTAIRKEAGKTVLRLMQERKNQFASSDMAAEGAGGGGVDTSNPLLK